MIKVIASVTLAKKRKLKKEFQNRTGREMEKEKGNGNGKGTGK